MRIQHTIALAVVFGLGLGVIATRGLAAQAKRTFYVVIEVDEITDADGYKAMMKIGPTNIVEVKHADGRYLVRTDNLVTLDGAPPKRFCDDCFRQHGKGKRLLSKHKRDDRHADQSNEIARIHCRGVIEHCFLECPLMAPTGQSNKPRNIRFRV